MTTPTRTKIPSRTMAMNNALRNCASDKLRRTYWPAYMPVRDGMTARREAIPNSADSKAFVPICSVPASGGSGLR
jgi:hypothetical protein